MEEIILRIALNILRCLFIGLIFAVSLGLFAYIIFAIKALFDAADFNDVYNSIIKSEHKYQIYKYEYNIENSDETHYFVVHSYGILQANVDAKHHFENVILSKNNTGEMIIHQYYLSMESIDMIITTHQKEK